MGRNAQLYRVRLAKILPWLGSGGQARLREQIEYAYLENHLAVVSIFDEFLDVTLPTQGGEW